MNPIFAFEDGKPICFSLKDSVQPAVIIPLIEKHGGSLVAPLRAQFALASRNRLIESGSFETVYIDTKWIEESVKSNTLIPPYQFILSSETLRHLDNTSRDVAELVKELIKNDGVAVYVALHRRLPHRTSLQWSELHIQHRVNIDRFVSAIKKRMDELRVEADAKAQKETNDMLMKALHTEPPASGTELVRFNAGSSELSPLHEDEDSCSSITSDDVQVRATTNPKAGQPMTDEEVSFMVDYVRELGRAPVGKDWKRFAESDPRGATRTVYGWNAAYRWRRESIHHQIDPSGSNVYAVQRGFTDVEDDDVNMEETESDLSEPESDHRVEKARRKSASGSLQQSLAVKVTPQDRQAVDTFARPFLPGYPPRAQWEQFREKYSRGNVRSIDGWRRVWDHSRRKSSKPVETSPEMLDHDSYLKLATSKELILYNGDQDVLMGSENSDNDIDNLEGHQVKSHGGNKVTAEDREAVGIFVVAFFPDNPRPSDWIQFRKDYYRGTVRSADAWARLWSTMKREANTISEISSQSLEQSPYAGWRSNANDAPETQSEDHFVENDREEKPVDHIPDDEPNGSTGLITPESGLSYRGRGRGVEVTDADKQAVKAFAQGFLPGNPSLANWTEFCDHYPRGRLRSPAAWSQQWVLSKRLLKDSRHGSLDWDSLFTLND